MQQMADVLINFKRGYCAVVQDHQLRAKSSLVEDNLPNSHQSKLQGVFHPA
jgi:hypothetical protein